MNKEDAFNIINYHNDCLRSVVATMLVENDLHDIADKLIVSEHGAKMDGLVPDQQVPHLNSFLFSIFLNYPDTLPIRNMLTSNTDAINFLIGFTRTFLPKLIELHNQGGS